MKLHTPRFRGVGWLAGGLALLVPALVSAADSVPAQFEGATPLEWSTRLADSQMARVGAAPRARWDYTDALFAVSLLHLADGTGKAAYSDYATKLIGDCVAADGTIAGY